jgi:hypothetical protein
MYWNTKYDEWYQVVKNPELMGLRLFVLNIKGRRSASADASIVYAWNSKGWSCILKSSYHSRRCRYKIFQSKFPRAHNQLKIGSIFVTLKWCPYKKVNLDVSKFSGFKFDLLVDLLYTGKSTGKKISD